MSFKGLKFMFSGYEYEIITEPTHEIIGGSDLDARAVNCTNKKSEIFVSFKMQWNDELFKYEPIAKTAHICGYGKVKLYE